MTIPDLRATIMHTLLETGEVRLTDGLPRHLIDAVTTGTPIRGLV